MCNIIVINRGEKEIESPRQFKEHFGILPINAECYSSDELDACLCHCDVDETFNQNNIEYKKDCGDYFVGQLELVKGDDD